FFFFSSRRRHTRFSRDWSSDVCSSDLTANGALTLHIARALKRIGLNWGADIGLLGFDELEWAELAGVGITTLKQPTWQMGYAARSEERRVGKEGRCRGAADT